ncbi:hypothetical protein [Halobacillus mangrovi]|nr:hypothetical protein [Halobacillus mangrovi]
MMTQMWITSILFLTSAAIWAVLAIIYEDFRLLNLFLFITFLLIGLTQRKKYKEKKDYGED